MVMRVGAIYRYPVKGLSAEKMERVALVPGECLPHDRRFAIALGSTVFDPRNPEWLPKTKFVMLMRDEKLALLQTEFDAETGVLTIAEDGRELLRGRLTEPEGCRSVAEFCANFLWPGVTGRCASSRRRARLCRRAAQAERDDRPICLADQPCEHRGARKGDERGDRPAPLSRQCLF